MVMVMVMVKVMEMVMVKVMEMVMMMIDDGDDTALYQHFDHTITTLGQHCNNME
jgi:hypothetical protein